MTFKDDLLSDMQNVFLNTAEFGEPVTYTPAGGVARIINAVPEKDGLIPGDEGKRLAMQNQMELYIANDATAGITAINRTSDRVVVTDRDGVSRTARIVKIIFQDVSMWHVLVEW